MKSRGIEEIPLLIGGECIPFSCRIEKDVDKYVCAVYSYNVRHGISIMKDEKKTEIEIKLALEQFKELFGEYFIRPVIAVALQNPNMLIHTVGVCMNTSRIEGGNFSLNEPNALGPAIWKVIDSIDKEKCNVLGSLGYNRNSYFEEMSMRTYKNNKDHTGEEAFRGYANRVVEIKTTSTKGRYISEDVPIGLGFLYSILKEMQYKNTATGAIIKLASCINSDGTPKESSKYFGESRTINNLGFTNLVLLLKYLRKYDIAEIGRFQYLKK